MCTRHSLTVAISGGGPVTGRRLQLYSPAAVLHQRVSGPHSAQLSVPEGVAVGERIRFGTAPQTPADSENKCAGPSARGAPAPQPRAAASLPRDFPRLSSALESTRHSAIRRCACPEKPLHACPVSIHVFAGFRRKSFGRRSSRTFARTALGWPCTRTCRCSLRQGR